jgi:excisionase family DNA binding protein
MAEDETKRQGGVAIGPVAEVPAEAPLEPPKRLPRKKIRSIRRATLTPREVAEITGYGIGRVYRMLRDGIIPHLPIEPGGKGFLVPRHALEEWMNSCGQR